MTSLTRFCDVTALRTPRPKLLLPSSESGILSPKLRRKKLNEKKKLNTIIILSQQNTNLHKKKSSETQKKQYPIGNFIPPAVMG